MNFNWQFQYPQLLWALILVPVLFLFYLLYANWKKRAAKRIGDPKLVKKLIPSYSPFKSFAKFFLFITAVALGIIAIANPRVPDEGSSEVRKGIDFVIALDVSNSMLATDIPPNRLLHAKQAIQKLIAKSPDDRIALVLFAGSAYVQMPLTVDHSAARMFVGNANPTVITAQGTSLADALEKSRLAFSEETERYKSVILITDGETHDENALEVAQELAEKGIMINTIGLGSPTGATIIDPVTNLPKRDEQGQTIISQLNEQLLQQVSAITKGTYIHFNNADQASTLIRQQLDQIEKTALADTSLMTYKSYFMWLVAPMLLLLITDLIVTDRKKVKQ
jgi:Ca-activated chloride channel family protein